MRAVFFLHLLLSLNVYFSSRLPSLTQAVLDAVFARKKVRDEAEAASGWREVTR